MAVTIPAITKPMTKSEKIMLRQLWPPSAYVRSCEQRQRSSSSAIDRSIDTFLHLYQMHKLACNPREDGEERNTFTFIKTRSMHHGDWFVNFISLLSAATFLPPSSIKMNPRFVNLFHLIIRIIRCELKFSHSKF